MLETGREWRGDWGRRCHPEQVTLATGLVLCMAARTPEELHGIRAGSPWQFASFHTEILSCGGIVD